MDTPQPLVSPRIMRMLTWLLPYCERFEMCDDERARIQARFATYHHRRIATERPGLLLRAPRHYAVAVDDHAIHIQGPYGYKAWTMRTAVAITHTGNGCTLRIRTRLDWRVALTLLEALIVVGVVAVIAGFPLASLVPAFALPFFYVAALGATRVEAAAIAQLVRRIAHGEEVPTLATLPEFD